jgi:hypothetical protein
LVFLQQSDFFLGAEFTQLHARRFGKRIEAKEVAVRVGKKNDAFAKASPDNEA